MRLAQPRLFTFIDKAASAPTQAHLRVHRQRRGQQNLPVADLVLMKAEANYTWLIWADGERMLMPRTLKYYEARLPAGRFVRLHRTYSVNLSYIKSVARTLSGVQINLSDGTQLSVARRRWTKIRMQLFQRGIW